MRLDPLWPRGQRGVGGRDMAGLLQTIQQLLHGRGLADLAGTDDHLEQLPIAPDRLLQVVHQRPLERFHLQGFYTFVAVRQRFSLIE